MPSSVIWLYASRNVASANDSALAKSKRNLHVQVSFR